jgi:hypothetical protein
MTYMNTNTAPPIMMFGQLTNREAVVAGATWHALRRST